MPRGIPNAKRDDTGLRYTTFNVPAGLNPKQGGSNYLKSESQNLWYRNSVQRSKNAPTAEESQENRRGSQVLVIHPGSRFIRVGRASDVSPISIPNVIARKTTVRPVPSPSYIETVPRPRRGTRRARTNGEELQNSADDPFEERLSQLTHSLRDRMKFYKLRVTPNTYNTCSTFNGQFEPETIPEHNDPNHVDWISVGTDTMVGEPALRLADSSQSGHIVRWPIYGAMFNTRDYPSIQVILGDIEEILRTALKDHLGISPTEYKNFSVVLVIPDLYDRSYLRNFAHMLLVTMGFKQMCAQQESLAASYGAGVSSACVVDLGAKKTSIACVDEGLVVSDTRLSLSMGGDDITEFFHALLERVYFPYREVNLARAYDWSIIEDLKARLCTLNESDVALNLYDFTVRRPGEATQKYGLRAYDEIILGPMCLFEPKVIEFDKKRIGFERPSQPPDVSEDIIEVSGEQVTAAMMISTEHLLHTAEPAAPKAEEDKDVASASGGGAEATPMDVEMADGESVRPVNSKVPPPDGSKNMAGGTEPTDATVRFNIDIAFEASKLPLDVAVFNSARAAGEEKIRKYLQAVLLIGGSALIPGMAHALESRLQAIATPLIANMEKVQIIQPPKDVDPRILAWKGAAVLGRMEGVSELWVTSRDWDIFGLRGLKERCFFL